MFSRYRNATAAATISACLAALILSSVLLSEPCYARSAVTPIVQPGDPDEFETGVSARGPDTHDKRSLSVDLSAREPERVLRQVSHGDVSSQRRILSRRWKTMLRAIGDFVSVLVVELDVR